MLAPSPMLASSGPDRQVLLVVTAGSSYEEALRDPLLTELARSGGVGLMTTSGGAERESQAAVSLGAGRSASGAPPESIPFGTGDDGLTIDVEPYRQAAGEAIPGLLGSALSDAGLTVGYLDVWSGAADPAMLVAIDREGRIPEAFLSSFPAPEEPAPDFLDPAAAGLVEEADLLVSPNPRLVPYALERTTAADVLVMVVTAAASEAMRERGDTVTPVVLAQGSPEALLDGRSRPAGITSRTTRRAGVVSNVDVAPTVLDFLGVQVPSEMIGSPIRASGEPPTNLHRRYIEYRRVVEPVGFVVLALALSSLAAGLAVVFGPWRLPPRLANLVAVAGLGSVALMVAMLPASLLPAYSWPAVVAAMAVAAGALITIALRVGRAIPRAAVSVAAAAGLVLVLLDGILGWPGGLTPLLGGGALDGERFFGLGNAHAGLVLAGTVLGAAWLPLWAGVGLFVAASAFAGLPFLGADLGGSLTLAVAAALWFGLQRWRALGWRTWALGAAALLGALALLVMAGRVLPSGETHLSRVAEGSGGMLGVLDLFWERLLFNLRTTSETPPAWLAVLGLPAWFALAVRPGRLRPSLDADANWRDAVLVLSLGGIVGYMLNDTYGTATVAFVFVSAAMLYPALATRSKGGRAAEETLEERGRSPL